jgi:hypothetical protein
MGQLLEIDSIEWFQYETRAAALRIVAGGDHDDFEERIDDAMADPAGLREVLKFLALFSFGAVFRHHNGGPIADASYRHRTAAGRRSGATADVHRKQHETHCNKRR